MRILDNYILRSTISIFVATISIFCFLYILVDAASNLDELINQKVSLQVLFRYYASFFPIILTQTSPIACLIATLFTYSRMNNNNEIIALRASGFNFWKITKPAICFGLLISMFIFWLNERFVPTATNSSEQIRDDNIIIKADTKKKQAMIKNLTFYGLKNRLFFIDSFDPNTSDLEGITIIGQDNNQNITEKINALNGKWSAGITWKFFQCQITTFDPENLSSPKDVKYYPEKLMDIKETPRDFLRQRLNVSAMNIRQLQEYILKFSTSGAAKALRNLQVDLYQKIAFPFSNMAVILVGMPLALLTGRRKAFTFTSLGIAIAIGFFFYVINAVGLALGKGGVLHPILSAWLAPMSFFIIAMYLIKTKF